MPFTTTLLFYLTIGVAVSAAVWLQEETIPWGERGFRAVTAIVFWPLYLPVLLRRPAQPLEAGEPDAVEPDHSGPTTDDMAAAIAQVETELGMALESLDGWAESVLARESNRTAELRAAWNLQAERIRELDRLLTQLEFAESQKPLSASTAEESTSSLERVRMSEQTRQENIQRLRKIRMQMYEDLMGTLAWVRELVTMIHLAKYTGAPATRAEELVAQIAAAVEGLSEVTTWQEEPPAAISGNHSPALPQRLPSPLTPASDA